MTGKLIHTTPPEHFCDYPGRTLPNGYVPNLDVGPGSVWQCDDCGQRWINHGHLKGWWKEGETRYYNLLGQTIGYNPEQP